MVMVARCSFFVAILTILLNNEHVEPMMVEVYFFVVIMTSMREDKCDNDCVMVMASMFVNLSELVLLLEVRSWLGNLTSAVVAHSRA